jgi:hypothetical protein
MLDHSSLRGSQLLLLLDFLGTPGGVVEQDMLHLSFKALSTARRCPLCSHGMRPSSSGCPGALLSATLSLPFYRSPGGLTQHLLSGTAGVDDGTFNSWGLGWGWGYDCPAAAMARKCGVYPSGISM